MDVIELWIGSTKAVIDQKGAWLTNLSDDEGDILFPKRSLQAADGAIKTRGGCHVCLPNFGPGGDSGQPQHGYGRSATWDVTDSTDSTLTLSLEHGLDGYEDLSSTLRYTLQERRISIELTCKNNGERDSRVAPGFHPYFMTARGTEEFMLNGEKHMKTAVEGTLFIDEGRSDMMLEVNDRNVVVSSNELKLQAVWTDQLGDYVCVEPTQAGYAFLVPVQNNQLISPGDSASYSIKISW